MKGSISLMEIIVWVIPLLIVALILILMFSKASSQSGSQINPTIAQASRAACASKSVIGGIIDRDRDTYDDATCDKCLGGDDRIDEDGNNNKIPDYIPDDCEPASFDEKLSIKEICNSAPKCKSKNCWADKPVGQCVLDAYKQV